VRIKLDENLPVSLVACLKRLGHDVDTVVEEQLGGSPDTDVWIACQREARFLITQDLDFSDNRRFRAGTHHGLLLLRLGSPGRQALLERITHLFGTEETDRWNGCFIVVSDRKIRIQRPDQH